MSRNCDICVYHLGGACSKYECEFQTLTDHDKQIRDETIANCIKALKQVCAKRPSIVMFDSDIEEIEKELEQIKGKQNE